jgi:hypothetical protein
VRRSGLLLTVWAAVLLWPVAGIGADAGSGSAQTVRIVFTGKGGGRYLDHTRWLREDTRLCYARLLADEDLSVRWRISWTAVLRRTAKGYALGKATRAESVVEGSVSGSAVRDSCDSADEEPGWSGETVCRSPLDTRSSGGISVTGRPGDRLRIALRGPVYASPGSPCELDIRNDQLVAAVEIAPDALARVAAGRATRTPVSRTSQRATARTSRTSTTASSTCTTVRTPSSGAAVFRSHRRSLVTVACALALAGPLAGCGSGSQTRDDARREACAAGRATLAGIGPVKLLADVAPALRAVVGVERQALAAVSADDPLDPGLRAGISSAERLLATIAADPLRTRTMSPLRTGVQAARRSVATAGELIGELCRRAAG